MEIVSSFAEQTQSMTLVTFSRGTSRSASMNTGLFPCSLTVVFNASVSSCPVTVLPPSMISCVSKRDIDDILFGNLCHSRSGKFDLDSSFFRKTESQEKENEQQQHAVNKRCHADLRCRSSSCFDFGHIFFSLRRATSRSPVSLMSPA